MLHSILTVKCLFQYLKRSRTNLTTTNSPVNSSNPSTTTSYAAQKSYLIHNCTPSAILSIQPNYLPSKFFPAQLLAARARAQYPPRSFSYKITAENNIVNKRVKKTPHTNGNATLPWRAWNRGRRPRTQESRPLIKQRTANTLARIFIYIAPRHLIFIRPPLRPSPQRAHTRAPAEVTLAVASWMNALHPSRVRFPSLAITGAKRFLMTRVESEFSIYARLRADRSAPVLAVVVVVVVERKGPKWRRRVPGAGSK